jgi:putative ABC transport system permease protein
MTADRAQHRLQNLLIVAETAIGLVLLVGSALLIHTFVRVMKVDPGFDTHNLLTANLSLPDNRYPDVKIDRFYRQLLPVISNIPGVLGASAAFPMPLSNNGMSISLEFDGRPVPKGQEPSEAVAVVTPQYFKTMRIPVVQGREFLPTDTEKTTPVMLITQSFARKYYPGEDAIGKMVKPGLSDGVTKSVMRQIVGVVADVKARGLTEEMTPQYYLPLSQALITAPTLAIRTEGDPNAVVTAVRTAVASMDSTVPLFSVRTMDEYVSMSSAQSRFQAVLLSCFGGIALVLFAVGLYAVLSYTVSQRTVEIGVRMALGAKREDMLVMFLKQGLRLTSLGAIAGVCAAVVLARFMSSMLYEVKALDPSSFISVFLVVAVVSVAASSIPALRAMLVDPIVALKDE